MSFNKSALRQEILQRKQYSVVPNNLIEAVQGNAAALVVWLYLFNQAEDWHPSIRQIMKATRLSQHTVEAAIQFLCDIEWLAIIKQDKRKKSLYIMKSGGGVAESATESVAESATLQYDNNSYELDDGQGFSVSFGPMAGL
jgi:hypothetical protein